MVRGPAADRDGRLAGLLRVERESHRDEWTVVELDGIGQAEAGDIRFRLVNQVLRDAAKRGAWRLHVACTDQDGNVTKVEFRDGTTLLGLALRDIIPWWLVGLLVGRELVLGVALLVAGLLMLWPSAWQRARPLWTGFDGPLAASMRPISAATWARASSRSRTPPPASSPRPRAPRAPGSSPR